MTELAKRLLAEKLIDDFYEEQTRQSTLGPDPDLLTERLKSWLPSEAQSLLLRWEANYAETCGEELRRFATFVADVILRDPGLHDYKVTAALNE